MRVVPIATRACVLALATACASPVAGPEIRLATPAALAEHMAIPPLAPVERGAYRTRDMHTGEELAQAEWTLQQETHAGRLVILLQEQGEESGQRGGPSLWSSHLRLDLRGPHLLVSTRESRDGDGRPVQVQRREFNYDAGTGQVTTTESRTGGMASRSIRLTQYAITTELLPAILRILPKTKDRRMRFDLITLEGHMLGMSAAVVGREQVQVPAGIFDCFKVELKPTGPTGMLAALTLPDLFMWHTVAAPHFWVKYQGPDGSAAPRQIIRELVRFETEAAAAGLPHPSRRHGQGEGLVTSPHPASGPHGSRAPVPASLAYVGILAAVVFLVGFEATRLLGD